jgi:CDP-diacylglycerol--serine O-phosphatidyltransferase
VLAATVYAYPVGAQITLHAVPVLAVVIVPALLMVSTVRFRSFKTLDLELRRSYTALMLMALGLALVWASPELALVAAAYAYLASAFVGMVIARLRRRQTDEAVSGENRQAATDASADGDDHSR